MQKYDEMAKNYFILILILLINSETKSQCCVYVDSSQTAQSLINTYYPVSGNVTLTPGQTTINLGAVPPNDIYGNSYGTTPINPGDLLLIIQMQGADFNSQNSNLYGSGTSNSGPDGLGGTGYTQLNNAGAYEFTVALNHVPLTGGVLEIAGSCISGNLINTYINQNATTSSVPARFQVIRVPQFSSLTLSSAITTVAWNGSVGGVIALDVSGTINLNGYSINASGTGFRGGYQNVRPSGNNDGVYTTHDLNLSSGKGEGICGTPRFMWDGLNQVDNGVGWIGYVGGDFGRGAPGNAGGGGNIHNAGAGGGGNGGAGGVGGNGVAGIGGTAVYPHGGRPGNNLPVAVDKIFMGGGGGGGDANNAITGVKGGVGGGIIFLKAGNIAGNGTIVSNGTAGQPGIYSQAPDGAGGGGAGGTILIQTTGNSVGASINLTARGGNGGNTLNDAGDPHGPGGGGGGGIIMYNIPGANIIINILQGYSGLTNNGSGITHGAANGQPGLSLDFQSTGYPPNLSIDLYPNPVADFSSSPACIGDTTFFTNLSSVSGAFNSSIVLYDWDFGDGTTSQTINPYHIYALQGTYQVKLKIETNLGCIDSIIKTITVNPLPVITATPSSSQICAGNSISLIASGGDTYIWAGLGTGSTQTVSPSSTTTYTVTGTDSNGCKASATAVVTVNSNPLVTISPPFPQICTGSSTTLSVSGVGSYIWSNGSTLQNINVSPAITTTYSVSVTDLNNCSGSGSVTLVVNPLPVAIAGNDQTICFGGSAILSVSGGTSYSWQPTAGLSSSVVSNPTASPSITTTYTVTVTDSNTCSATDDVTVNVYNITSPFTATSPICIENSSTLTYNGNGTSAASYNWNLSGGNIISGSGAGPIEVQWPTGGIHNVTLTVTEPGCNPSQPTTLQVNVTDISTIKIENNPLCTGDQNGSVQVIPSGGQMPYSYLWSVAGNTTSVISNLPQGTYYVTVTDASNCVQNDTLTITDPPLLNTSITNYTNVSCYGGNDGTSGVSVTGGTAPFSYNWSTSAGSTSSITGLFVGTYYVTVTDANSCTSISSVILVQPPALTMQLTPFKESCLNDCDGEIQVIAAGGTPGYTYSWNTNPPQTTSSATNLCAGKWTVSLSDANACIITDSAVIITNTFITALANASPLFGDIPVDVSFIFTGSGAQTYHWDFGDGSFSTLANPVHTYTSPGNFNIILTVNSGAPDFCEDTYMISISLEEPSSVTIPNIFTPNGDGYNDVFKAETKSIKNESMIIFNRWGRKVHEWNRVDGFWDGGTYSDGTYYYIYEGLGFDGKEYNLNGIITLLRK